MVQILEAIAKGGGKGRYPNSLPCCGSGGYEGLQKEWPVISLEIM